MFIDLRSYRRIWWTVTSGVELPTIDSFWNSSKDLLHSFKLIHLTKPARKIKSKMHLAEETAGFCLELWPGKGYLLPAPSSVLLYVTISSLVDIQRCHPGQIVLLNWIGVHIDCLKIFPSEVKEGMEGSV